MYQFIAMLNKSVYFSFKFDVNEIVLSLEQQSSFFFRVWQFNKNVRSAICTHISLKHGRNKKKRKKEIDSSTEKIQKKNLQNNKTQRC